VPVYDYKCGTCGAVKEHFMKYVNVTETQPCAACGGEATRQLSTAAISYQGSKTTRQKVPDSFKDVLRNIRDKAPGGKEMKSSVI
jgi:putative FmdB family regulatory protein